MRGEISHLRQKLWLFSQNGFKKRDVTEQFVVCGGEIIKLKYARALFHLPQNDTVNAAVKAEFYTPAFIKIVPLIHPLIPA